MKENKKKRKKESQESLKESIKEIKEALQGLSRCIADQSKDRPKYFASFIQSWENSAAVARQLAAALLSGNLFTYDEKVMEVLTYPYSFFGLFYFARLMDHMEYEEEDQLRAVAADTQNAWHEFAAAVHCQHFDAKKDGVHLDGLIMTHQCALQQIVLDLYFGERAPVLRPEWAHLLKQLEDDVNCVSKLNYQRTHRKGVEF